MLCAGNCREGREGAAIVHACGKFAMGVNLTHTHTHSHTQAHKHTHTHHCTRVWSVYNGC